MPAAQREEVLSGPYARPQVRDAALLVLTGIILYLCWVLARPFLAGITWALALAVVAYPLHRWLEHWFRPNPAALLSVLAVVIVLLGPGAFVIQSALDEAGGRIGSIGQNFTPARLHDTADGYPLIARTLEWLSSRFDLNRQMEGVARMLASYASTVLGGSVRFVTGFVIMLVTLFYCLRDHRSFLQYLRGLVPLSEAETEELFGRLSGTIHATVYGNVVVKLVQGVLGGAMFWVLGLPAPVLCGIAISLCAMLPLVGTAFVWGPAVIILLTQGNWVKAIVLTIWGSLVISLVDNFLYPLLVANELRVHTLGILLSIFGGMIAFGLAGVVLGPVILASAMALVEVWRRRAEHDPERSA